MMQFMKKFFLVFQILFLFIFSVTPVFAQGLLPGTELSDEDCEEMVSSVSSVEDIQTYLHSESDYLEPFLACSLRTGRFALWMLPYLALLLIQFFSILAGVLSVLFVVIGGYNFIIGSLSEDKEKGKKTVMYALIGFVVSMLAYTIVNLVQIAVSG